MGIKQELKKCYIERNDNQEEIIAKYEIKLYKAGKKELLRATARLLRAYCAAPGVSPNRKLDALATKDGSYLMLKTLIRNYSEGVESILDAYDAYFNLENTVDFWSFFNKRLNLPDNWYAEVAE